MIQFIHLMDAKEQKYVNKNRSAQEVFKLKPYTEKCHTLSKIFLIAIAATLIIFSMVENAFAWDGNYLVVDGANDYADFQDEGPLDVGYDGTKSFTVEVWIYPTDYGCIISDDAYDIGYVTQDSDSCIKFKIYLGQSSVTTFKYKSLANGWHHIVGMFDNLNNRAAIGIDGDISWYDNIDDDNGLYNDIWALVIGSYTSSSGFFAGKIDDVRISDTLRYSGNSYAMPVEPFTSDSYTLALWHFDDAPGSTTFADSSGNGNTLTAYNGATTEGSITDTTPASITGTLTLPAEANGKEYWVLIDNDTDGDNGYVNATIGTCGSGTTVDYTINNVNAGTYYVYAGVRVVSAHDSPPQSGDYFGFYGTGSDLPDEANADVPSSGTVTFDITLSIMGEAFDDSDGDDVPDQEEQGSDGTDTTYDGNNDNIPDSQQDNVASGHTYDGQNYVTVAVPDPATLSDAEAVDNPSSADSPSGVEFTYGFFTFTVNNAGAGGTATATLYLPAGATPDTYFKYGPTPTNQTDHWYEFLYDGETGAEIDNNVITLHFVDGKRGDDDLDDTNGIIVDQGGPGFTTTPPPPPSGGGGGGCFIATAAYGSPMEPHVTILREFRDRFMLTNPVGKAFVELYYTSSPPVADFIASHDTMRFMVRWSLLPLVGMSWMGIHSGLTITMVFVFLLLVMIGASAVIVFRRMG